MVSSVSSINQYPVNREQLEVIRRLQSLGVAPTGNLIVDRQHLQTAELQKKQITLASNSEVSLNKIEGTNKDFYSTINSLNKTNVHNLDQEYGLMINSAHSGIVSFSENYNNDIQYQMTGANQLAELNKYRFGLIA